jgi:hypothetical protein
MCAAALAELTQLLVEGGLLLPVWGLVVAAAQTACLAKGSQLDLAILSLKPNSNENAITLHEEIFAKVTNRE